MKKFRGSLLLFFLSTLCIFGFSFSQSTTPNTYYQVYLDDEVLGMIESKEELENYIDEKEEEIKEKLGVSRVYQPNGLQIKKVTTYKTKISSIEKIYQEIKKRKPFTVKGYQFTITKNDKKQKIFVIKKDTFKKALETTMQIFVGKERYESYRNNTQEEIQELGSIIENIYIEEPMTVRAMNISTDEKIFLDEDTLSQYLLFGEKPQKRTYTLTNEDTSIESIAFKNQISVEELILANSNLKSTNQLLYEGQELSIAYLNPQVTVVVEEYVVKDVENDFATEERYDSNKLVGDDSVLQEGEKGLDRVTQRVRIKNGISDYIKFISKEELKPRVNRIILKGQKIVPNVGTLTNWQWPTGSGYTITSNYAYRRHPIRGDYQLHPALDIAGLPYGAPIYASNNGVVTMAKYYSTYGNCVIINHNNGYYTLYAHMSAINVRVGQVVSKGTTLGRIGMTGSATGPHLHYEVWKGGAPWGGGVNVNPWTVHR